MPELLCQSWTELTGNFMKSVGIWFIPVKSQYPLSQCQHIPPYICFEGVVELCSQLWLVVAVRQQNKQNGSIVMVSSFVNSKWRLITEWSLLYPYRMSALFALISNKTLQTHTQKSYLLCCVGFDLLQAQDFWVNFLPNNNKFKLWSHFCYILLSLWICFLKEKSKVFKYAKWPSKWLTNESLVWDLMK